MSQREGVRVEQSAAVALAFLQRRYELVRRFIQLLTFGLVSGAAGVLALFMKAMYQSTWDTIHTAVQALTVLLTGSVAAKMYSEIKYRDELSYHLSKVGLLLPQEVPGYVEGALRIGERK